MAEPKPTSLLSASSLTCIREERILFDELSFDINPGDIVQIEGPNGAGKTSCCGSLQACRAHTGGKSCFREKLSLVAAMSSMKTCFIWAISPA